MHPSSSLSLDNTTDQSSHEMLSPLEQEILDEYARLLGNMNKLSTALNDLADSPTAEVLDSLRTLERKMGLVFTLLKASVYSIVLQTQIRQEEGREDGDGEG
ncbi:hypothetical protein FGG08_000386 [Glutinoglossum americanum]|uniref:DASH complex subunit DAD3 n=1 Tax=Glutinoglossum americanum TaxID=1670608 RepID=A0A9P8IDB3_9PEZI|nr:hypothetical protein FGG08_000386 [Glutinoglossum americanum]